jgi:hypothetical protein
LNEGKTALESALMPGAGLNGREKVVRGTTWYASLVDSYVEEGGLYAIDDDTTPNYIGTNNFEACLLFEHNGTKKYYGGGAGIYATAAEVLLAFHSLCWFSITYVNNSRMARVEKVVKRWRDRQGNILP